MPEKYKIIKIARSFIGTPYKYAAKQEEIPNFFDCSSFTQYLYKQLNIEILRSTILQATAGKEISTNGPFEAGDLLFYRGDKGHYNDSLFPGKNICIGHVVMYTENNKAIHAANGKGIIEENLSKISKSKCGQIIMVKRLL